MTTDRRTFFPRPALAPVPARALAGALTLLVSLLGGCDGGIFGTGDGTSDAAGIVVPEAAPPGSGGADVSTDGGGEAGGTGAGDGADAGGTDAGGDDSGSATGGGVDSVGGEGPAQMPDGGSGTDDPPPAFTNLLAADGTATPRLRLINADEADVRVRVLGIDGRTLVTLPAVRPGASGARVEAPLETYTLLVERLSPEGVVTARHRLEPVTLGTASVTTLVVRDAELSASTVGTLDVVPLETRTAPDDAAQSLVRVVLGTPLADPDDGGATPLAFVLSPGGASPGGGEARFEDLTYADAPASGYRTMTAGDYLLDGGDGAAASLAVSLTAGTVHTLVIDGVQRVLDVVDGAPGTR